MSASAARYRDPTIAIAPLDFLRQAIEFGRRHQVLLFTSFSKTHSMASWRSGSAVGNASALQGPQATVAQNNSVHQRRRDRVLDGLRPDRPRRPSLESHLLRVGQTAGGSAVGPWQPVSFEAAGP